MFGSAITNYNVIIGGVSQLQQNARYSYELFAEQFSGVNAVNSGMSDSLCSCLVSQSTWERKHSYIYLQYNRGKDLDKSSPKSIQLQFQNQSAKKMNYFVFVEYQTSINLDLGLGVLQM